MGGFCSLIGKGITFLDSWMRKGSWGLRNKYTPLDYMGLGELIAFGIVRRKNSSCS